MRFANPPQLPKAPLQPRQQTAGAFGRLPGESDARCSHISFYFISSIFLIIFQTPPPLLFLNMDLIYLNLLQSLQSSNSPPTGQHSRSSTAESSDGLRQRTGPVFHHNMYLQLMQRYSNISFCLHVYILPFIHMQHGGTVLGVSPLPRGGRSQTALTLSCFFQPHSLAFPGQARDIIPPACPGLATEPPRL